MDLQVVLMIDVIDDELTNTIEVDLRNDPLVCELQNLRSELSKGKDEVLSLITKYGSYDGNTCEQSKVKKLNSAIGWLERCSTESQRKKPYEVKKLK